MMLLLETIAYIKKKSPVPGMGHPSVSCWSGNPSDYKNNTPGNSVMQRLGSSSWQLCAWCLGWNLTS